MEACIQLRSGQLLMDVLCPCRCQDVQGLTDICPLKSTLFVMYSPLVHSRLICTQLLQFPTLSTPSLHTQIPMLTTRSVACHCQQEGQYHDLQIPLTRGQPTFSAPPPSLAYTRVTHSCRTSLQCSRSLALLCACLC